MTEVSGDQGVNVRSPLTLNKSWPYWNSVSSSEKRGIEKRLSRISSSCRIPWFSTLGPLNWRLMVFCMSYTILEDWTTKPHCRVTSRMGTAGVGRRREMTAGRNWAQGGQPGGPRVGLLQFQKVYLSNDWMLTASGGRGDPGCVVWGFLNCIIYLVCEGEKGTYAFPGIDEEVFITCLHCLFLICLLIALSTEISRTLVCCRSLLVCLSYPDSK